MAWGFVRILIFATAFLVGLLLVGSGNTSTDLIVTQPSSGHVAGESKCGEGKFVLADGQDQTWLATQASGR